MNFLSTKRLEHNHIINSIQKFGKMPFNAFCITDFTFSLLNLLSLSTETNTSSKVCKLSSLIFEVMIKMVFLKSILRPNPSVMCPSSNTCKSKLKISGCAFSISSSKTIAYGFLLTFSVSCPPSSYPTYPEVLQPILISKISPCILTYQYESKLPRCQKFFAKTLQLSLPTQ